MSVLRLVFLGFVVLLLETDIDVRNSGFAPPERCVIGHSVAICCDYMLLVKMGLGFSS